MTSLPPIKLTAPPENTLEQCDATLGYYLRAWDQVEMQLLPLFNALLGTHQNATLILLRSGLSQPTLRDISQALATLRLKPADKSQLAALLRRWKSASAKRNRIVHGHWQMNIQMIKGPSGKEDHTKTTWVRFYDPADPSILQRIMAKRRDKKLLAAHQFQLKDITQAANDVFTLAKDLRAFNDRVTVVSFLNPKPINIDQSTIQTRPKADGD